MLYGETGGVSDELIVVGGSIPTGSKLSLAVYEFNLTRGAWRTIRSEATAPSR